MREAIEKFLDLRFFRGETLITWHYRELPRITKLKYFVFMTYVEERDKLRLLDKLEEDGAYGCWTYEYPGYGRYSRDLIESVNEIAFLERELALSKRGRFSVLDVGAGYGRLAHRITGAYGSAVSDYACVDAIPESTFVCEHYLRERGIAPPARAVPLHEQADALEPGTFDLALNVHSFSECTLRAIEWWVARLAELRVPQPDDHPQRADRAAVARGRQVAPRLHAGAHGGGLRAGQARAGHPRRGGPRAARARRPLPPVRTRMIRVACAAEGEAYVAHAAAMIHSVLAQGDEVEFHFLHTPNFVWREEIASARRHVVFHEVGFERTASACRCATTSPRRCGCASSCRS